MAVLKIKKNGEWVRVGIGAQGPRGPVGPAGSGAGDMLESTYDPQGKAQDIFKYVDDALDDIPTPDVSGQINAHNADVEAHADIRNMIQNIPTPDVSGQIDEHNTDAEAHADIRASVSTVTIRRW